MIYIFFFQQLNPDSSDFFSLLCFYSFFCRDSFCHYRAQEFFGGDCKGWEDTGMTGTICT